MHPGLSILIVYNAASETLSKVNDPLMKTGVLGSERCNLHALTYSPIGMKKEWKRFIYDLKISVRSLSRDEFASEFPSIVTDFPVIFFQNGNDLTRLLSMEEINQCRELGELIRLMQQRVFGSQ